MFSIDAKDLEKLEPLQEGEMVYCPTCNKTFKVELGTDAETGKKVDALMFITCPEHGAFIVGIQGRLMANSKRLVH